MKLEINQKDLLQKVTMITNMVDRKNPLEILRQMKIKIGQNDIKLVGSNSEMTLICSIKDFEKDSDEEIELVVNPFTLKEFLKTLKGSVNINITKKQIEIKDEKSKFKMAVIDGGEYPKISMKHGNNEVIFEKKNFINALKKVSKTISLQLNRPILNGVNIVGDSIQNTVVFQSTDSYRYTKNVIENEVNENFNVVLPAKCVDFILKNTIVDENKLKIIFDTNALFIQHDEYIIKSRLIEGAYPQVERLLSANIQTTIKVECDYCLDDLKKCSIVSSNETPYVLLKTQDNELTLLSHYSGDVIECQITIEKQGDDVEETLDLEYLKHAISNIDTRNACLYFQGSLKPIFVLNDGSKEDIVSNDFIQMLMPVRTM